MFLKKYSLLNKKFWDREYYSPNVEGFIFRLKPKLLDLYIKKKKLGFLIMVAAKDQILNI